MLHLLYFAGLAVIWCSYFAPICLGIASYFMQFKMTDLLVKNGVQGWDLGNSVVLCMTKLIYLLTFIYNLIVGQPEAYLTDENQEAGIVVSIINLFYENINKK